MDILTECFVWLPFCAIGWVTLSPLVGGIVVGAIWVGSLLFKRESVSLKPISLWTIGIVPALGVLAWVTRCTGLR